MSAQTDTLEQRVTDALDELLERNYGDTLHFKFHRLERASSVEFDAPPNRVSMALQRLAHDDECGFDIECTNPDSGSGGGSSWTATRRDG